MFMVLKVYLKYKSIQKIDVRGVKNCKNCLNEVIVCKNKI